MILVTLLIYIIVVWTVQKTWEPQNWNSTLQLNMIVLSYEMKKKERDIYSTLASSTVCVAH